MSQTKGNIQSVIRCCASQFVFVDSGSVYIGLPETCSFCSNRGICLAITGSFNPHPVPGALKWRRRTTQERKDLCQQS